MTSWRYAVSHGPDPRPGVRRAAVADRDAPAAHLLDHGIHERALDLEAGRVSGEALVERVDRFEDRVARGPLVEEVEVQVVAVDVRDAGLESRTELRIGVLSDGSGSSPAGRGD